MKTEIKLDQSTLPKDGTWVECETHTHCEIVAIYSKEEQGFFPIRNNPTSFISAFDAEFWNKLEIDFDWVEWINQPNDGSAAISGFDRFGNEFEANGIYTLNNDKENLEHISDIEFLDNKVSCQESR